MEILSEIEYGLGIENEDMLFFKDPILMDGKYIKRQYQFIINNFNKNIKNKNIPKTLKNHVECYKNLPYLLKSYMDHIEDDKDYNIYHRVPFQNHLGSEYRDNDSFEPQDTAYYEDYLKEDEDGDGDEDEDAQHNIQYDDDNMIGPYIEFTTLLSDIKKSAKENISIIKQIKTGFLKKLNEDTGKNYLKHQVNKYLLNIQRKTQVHVDKNSNRYIKKLFKLIKNSEICFKPYGHYPFVGFLNEDNESIENLKMYLLPTKTGSYHLNLTLPHKKLDFFNKNLLPEQILDIFNIHKIISKVKKIKDKSKKQIAYERLNLDEYTQKLKNILNHIISCKDIIINDDIEEIKYSDKSIFYQLSDLVVTKEQEKNVNRESKRLGIRLKNKDITTNVFYKNIIKLIISLDNDFDKLLELTIVVIYYVNKDSIANKNHIKLGKIIQLITPLLVGTYSTPDFFSVKSSDQYTKGSYRIMTIYDVGALSSNLKEFIPSERRSFIDKPIEDIPLPKWIQDNRLQIYKKKDQIEYSGLSNDFRKDITYLWYYGFEFRMLDNFDLDCLEDIINIILLLADNMNEKIIDFDTVNNTKLSNEFNNILVNGSEAVINSTYINLLNELLDLNIDIAIYSPKKLLDTIYNKLHKMTLIPSYNNKFSNKFIDDYTKISSTLLPQCNINSNVLSISETIFNTEYEKILKYVKKIYPDMEHNLQEWFARGFLEGKKSKNKYTKIKNKYYIDGFICGYNYRKYLKYKKKYLNLR